jgi:conjugative transfer signal peptidase TraF
MTSRALAQLLLGALGITIVLAAGCAALARHLLLNVTESMPVGIYWLAPGQAPRRGDRVAFPIPPAVERLVHARAYLPDGALLLKEVVATEGDRVCTDGGVLTIDGHVFGPVLDQDSRGRPLPQAGRCAPLARGELYVASPHPQSFDSRSFGPLESRDVRGVVTPLWIF